MGVRRVDRHHGPVGCGELAHGSPHVARLGRSVGAEAARGEDRREVIVVDRRPSRGEVAAGTPQDRRFVPVAPQRGGTGRRGDPVDLAGDDEPTLTRNEARPRRAVTPAGARSSRARRTARGAARRFAAAPARPPGATPARSACGHERDRRTPGRPRASTAGCRRRSRATGRARRPLVASWSARSHSSSRRRSQTACVSPSTLLTG